MQSTACHYSVLIALMCVSFSGCDYFQGSQTLSDADLADLDDDMPSEPNPESKSGLSDVESETRADHQFALKLTVGDSFPFSKRIEQKLTQADANGDSVYRTVTEFSLSLDVKEARGDGSKRFDVYYHRVRHQQDISGRVVEYSSDSPQPIPAEALVYAGLHENGFSFWIGSDNRVIEIVGFADFLQRCLKNVPPQLRQSAQRQIEGVHTENDLANFLDEGIGLLPYNKDSHSSLQVGTSWELKPRQTGGAVPIQIHMNCARKELSDTSAEIRLTGTIAGDRTPITIGNSHGAMKVYVNGGRCAGTCTIDRLTGLPTKSEVSRYLEMSVQLADGSMVEQRKETMTSINSYLSQNSSQRTPPNSAEVQQARHSRETDSSRRFPQ